MTDPLPLLAHLRAATASVRGLFGAAACSCALVDPSGEQIRFVAASGTGSESIVGTVMGTERGIAGWVVMSGQAIVVADVQVDPRFARDIAEQTGYVPSSIMAAPLLGTDGEVIGVIEVLDRSGTHDNSGRDLDVLGTLAQQLAAIVALAPEDRAGSTPKDDGLNQAVRELAGAGPDAALLAERVLSAVHAFVRTAG